MGYTLLPTARCNRCGHQRKNHRIISDDRYRSFASAYSFINTDESCSKSNCPCKGYK